VLEGLREGDEVILYPGDRIKDGSRVNSGEDLRSEDSIGTGRRLQLADARFVKFGGACITRFGKKPLPFTMPSDDLRASGDEGVLESAGVCRVPTNRRWADHPQRATAALGSPAKRLA
jgi:hypothetical protein